MERASRLLSIGKQASWFSKGIVQVTAKMTDLGQLLNQHLVYVRKNKRGVKNKIKISLTYYYDDASILVDQHVRIHDRTNCRTKIIIKFV